MKKVKIVLWVIIITVVGIIVYQNKDLFLVPGTMVFNLGFKYYKTPELPMGIFFLALFLIGYVVAYFFSLFRRFRTAKIIKNLNATINSCNEKITALEDEIDALQRGPEEPEEQPEINQESEIQSDSEKI